MPMPADAGPSEDRPAGRVEVRVRPDDSPWLHYLSRVRQVIDSFYPDVEPQPLRLYGPANDLTPDAASDAALPE
jgi:hypothetical protein